MSGSADSRKGHSVKKRLSDGTLKEYTYSAKVSKQQSGTSLTAKRVAGSSPGPATHFRGDLSLTNFYGHSSPSAVSRRAVVSCWLSTGESICT